MALSRPPRLFEVQESQTASLSARIASLEEEVGHLRIGKKRMAMPDPNKKSMTLAKDLAADGTIPEPFQATEEAGTVEDVIEMGGQQEDGSSNWEAEELPVVCTCTDWEVKIPRKY
ncbi:hypothetical protein Focb16_v004274 [Fusarium oxysporum f. sp. cubense]|uniref:Uncharacterized protein n=1 Tax=Fusarium oxysporum f. sp. cubense TaxID=61366 RepID=A0A559KRX0_FUSOC|nr:hypothetical protein Focb16_v004274 [Fusarium oxysporum f. sp. cubense]